MILFKVHRDLICGKVYAEVFLWLSLRTLYIYIEFSSNISHFHNEVV